MLLLKVLTSFDVSYWKIVTGHPCRSFFNTFFVLETSSNKTQTDNDTEEQTRNATYCDKHTDESHEEEKKRNNDLQASRVIEHDSVPGPRDRDVMRHDATTQTKWLTYFDCQWLAVSSRELAIFLYAACQLLLKLCLRAWLLLLQ